MGHAHDFPHGGNSAAAPPKGRQSPRHVNTPAHQLLVSTAVTMALVLGRSLLISDRLHCCYGICTRLHLLIYGKLHCDMVPILNSNMLISDTLCSYYGTCIRLHSTQICLFAMVSIAVASLYCYLSQAGHC